jgi:predicted site-specific integrase-resolvase
MQILGLTQKQVAAIVGVSRQALSAWRRRSKGPPYVMIGPRVFYPEVAFYDWHGMRKQHYTLGTVHVAQMIGIQLVTLQKWQRTPGMGPRFITVDHPRWGKVAKYSEADVQEWMRTAREDGRVCIKYRPAKCRAIPIPQVREEKQLA